MDGPEPLMEADEYLQPKFKPGAGTATSNSAVSGVETQTSSLKPSTSTSWANNMTSPDCLTSDGSKPESWDHELLRYAQQAPEGSELRHYYNNGVCASDSSSSRYCSDPMKSEGNFDSLSRTKEAQVGNLKLNLPLDEDDYLVPSPQQNQSASAYMDLIGENGDGHDVKDLRNFTGFVGISTKRCVDNPEYLMSDASVPTQTLGIPVEPVALESPCVSEASDATPRPTTSYLPQRSVEEESMSDHEYYNDLQRELQPLRRNETTV